MNSGRLASDSGDYIILRPALETKNQETPREVRVQKCRKDHLESHLVVSEVE